MLPASVSLADVHVVMEWIPKLQNPQFHDLDEHQREMEALEAFSIFVYVYTCTCMYMYAYVGTCIQINTHHIRTLYTYVIYIHTKPVACPVMLFKLILKSFNHKSPHTFERTHHTRTYKSSRQL
jgi:hypothetical protein